MDHEYSSKSTITNNPFLELVRDNNNTEENDNSTQELFYKGTSQFNSNVDIDKDCTEQYYVTVIRDDSVDSVSLDKHEICSDIGSTSSEIPVDRIYYIEDEVCRILDDGAIEFGIVTSSGLAGNNNLQVIWTAHNRVECQDLIETGLLRRSVQPNKVALVDRKLRCGDLVRVEPNGEFGEIVNVEWMAYLKVAETNKAIVDVRCRHLEPLLPYQVGNRIEFNGWIGVVKSVESKATIMFNDGQSCIIFYSHFSPENTPYPGRKVSFSTDELEELGTEYLENGRSIRGRYGSKPPDGLVVFLKVKSIEVEWKMPISVPELKNGSSIPDFTKLKRSQLKESVRNLDGPHPHHYQLDSDQSELLDNFHYYTAKQGDLSLSIKNKELNLHIISEFFLGVNEDSESGQSDNDTICAGAPAVVSVLRTCRVIDVQWKSGKIGSFRSCDVIEKVSFPDPFRQIVQKKGSLTSSSTHDYGITLMRNKDDTVLVKWFSKGVDRTDAFEETTTTESKYDIDYHFKHGRIIPGELVCRSKECKLPTDMFQFGIVDRITSDGKVVVIDRTTNCKETLNPFDLEVVLENERKPCVPRTISEKEFLKKLFIDTATEEGDPITIQESYFSPRLLRNYNLATIPADEKFKILPRAPISHYFYSDIVEYDEEYFQKVSFDRKMMLQFFAEGIWVIGYEDRLDLYSCMINGTPKTPYEDGLFNFDIQLPLEYPNVPPNFYLTTWFCEPNSIPIGLTPGSHHFSKLYTLKTLSLLEAILAVQKFLFVINPYENDEISKEDTRNFYCQVTINVLDSLFRILAKPPTNWRYDVVRYVHATAPRIIARLTNIVLMAKKSIKLNKKNYKGKIEFTPFPVPVTKGFVTAVENRIRRFQELNLTTAGPKLH